LPRNDGLPGGMLAPGLRPARAVLWLLLVVWLCAAGTGLVWLMAYDNTPGTAAEAPARWPALSTLPRDDAGPTLVMLAHPRCDCTRASLGELAELLARLPQRPRTLVVFIRPGGVEAAWEMTATFARAETIPGVTVIRDEQGAEARRFRVSTSGQTLLYDRNGQLLYSGGITAARGKAGDNVGRSTLHELLAGVPAARLATNVFGCSLFASGDRPPDLTWDSGVR
jgi:hypothetical protein